VRLLRGACPERYEILPLHFAQGQNDRKRRARNDTIGLAMIKGRQV